MELRNKQIIVETTNLCSAHCIICPRELYTQRLRIMDMQLFKKIIDDAAQYSIESIDTCGFGDCFMDKLLFDRLEYVHKKIPECKTFVSSSAFYMNQSKWADIAEHIDILKLSIYGVTKETYEAFHRGNLKFETTMKNILGFLEYIKPLKKKPWTVGLFVDTDLNRHERNQWINTWRPKLDEIMIYAPHNWINARSYRTVDKGHQVSCGRPASAPLYVQTDGIVVPCCWCIHQEIPLGNLNTQTIEEVYRGKSYMDLRRAHENLNFSQYVCKDCDQTNFDPSVLLYASNSNRKVGQLTSNESEIKNKQ